MLQVLITKNTFVSLANPVLFRITPLTLDEAFARRVIAADMVIHIFPNFPVDDISSPGKAGNLTTTDADCTIPFHFVYAQTRMILIQPFFK